MNEDGFLYYSLHSPLFWGMIACLVFAIIIGLCVGLIWQPEIDRKNSAEKTKLDAMSCEELGKWIIDNSHNPTYTDGGYRDINYPYAEAKYLVCTHTGVPPT